MLDPLNESEHLVLQLSFMPCDTYLLGMWDNKKNQIAII